MGFRRIHTNTHTDNTGRYYKECVSVCQVSYSRSWKARQASLSRKTDLPLLPFAALGNRHNTRIKQLYLLPASPRIVAKIRRGSDSQHLINERWAALIVTQINNNPSLCKAMQIRIGLDGGKSYD